MYQIWISLPLSLDLTTKYALDVTTDWSLPKCIQLFLIYQISLTITVHVCRRNSCVEIHDFKWSDIIEWRKHVQPMLSLKT